MAPEEEGLRIDKYLSSVTQVSRSKLQELIERKMVLVQSEPVKSSYKVQSGDQISILSDENWEAQKDLRQTEKFVAPLAAPLEILYEDDFIIVINKPAGLVVHPAAGHFADTLVNILAHHCPEISQRINNHRPGIVHRLDKETSGILIVGKTDQAVDHLSAQFKSRQVDRLYEAVVVRCIKNPSGTIESYIARHPIHRKKMASVKPKARSPRLRAVREEGVATAHAGKRAITHYRVLQSSPLYTRVELKLETGRTHQIRVHLSEMSHPIVGDKLYGFKPPKNFDYELESRFLLHAKLLGIVHPVSGEKLRFEVDWPLQDARILKKMRLTD